MFIIKEINIEGFGKFTNYKHTFNDGLNYFNEENGWGKTTISNFLYMMLYDIANSRNKVDKDLLKQYCPLVNKKIYKGSMKFEFNNKEYTIIKDFNNKEVQILDSNSNPLANNYKIFKDFNAIGETIFSLDAPSFKKTVFIDNDSLNTKYDKDDTLKTRILKEIGSISDVKGYENIIEELEDTIKKYAPSGKTSLAKENSEKIKELKKDIDEEETINNNLSSLKKDKTNREIELKNKQDEQKDVGKQLENANLIGKRDAVINDINDRKDHINEAQVELNDLKKKVNNLSIDEVIKDLKNLEVFVSEYIVNQRNKDGLEQTLINTQEDLSRYLNNYGLALNIPTQEIYDDLKVKISEYSRLKNENERKEFLIKQRQEALSLAKQDNKKKPKTLMLILSGFILVAGIAIYALIKDQINDLATIIYFLIYGAITLIGGAIGTYQLLKKDHKQEEVAQIEEDSQDLKTIDLTSNLLEISSIFNKYNINISKDSNLDEQLEKLRKHIDYINRKNEKIKEDENKVKEYDKNINNLKSELDNIFSKYNLESDEYNFKLNELRSLSASIQNKESNLKNEKDQLDKKELENRNLINQTMGKTSLSVEELNQKHSKLINEIDSLKDELRDIDSKIKTSEELLDEISNKKDELEDKKALEEDYKKKHAFYILLKSKLKESYKSLQDKYLSPINNSLSKYINVDNTLNTFSLNKDLEFTYSTSSITNKIDSSYLSNGYQDYVNLAIRFTILDSLYKNEKVLVILDDPFVNLDKTRLKEVKDIIKNLSSRYQLIYFTCHDSRKMD